MKLFWAYRPKNLEGPVLKLIARRLIFKRLNESHLFQKHAGKLNTEYTLLSFESKQKQNIVLGETAKCNMQHHKPIISTNV